MGGDDVMGVEVYDEAEKIKRDKADALAFAREHADTYVIWMTKAYLQKDQIAKLLRNDTNGLSGWRK